MLNEDLIQSRLKLWLGYGNFKAPVWFVGMEEGFGGAEDPEQRFRATYGKTTMDIRRGMEPVREHIRALNGEDKHPLWNFQIAFYLYLKNGRKSTLEERCDYIANSFGDIDLEETACFDLMPLPSHGAKESDWIYAKYATENLKLRSRKEYINTYKQNRVQLLKKYIEQYKPKLIIFCSTDTKYLLDWIKVIGAIPKPINTDRTYFIKKEETAFCVIPNGTQSGCSFEELYKLIDKIRDKIEIF